MESKKKQFIEQVFEEMYGELKRYLWYHSYDKELIEDILQETYLAAYNHVDELMNNDNYKAWMYTTAMNKAMKMNKLNRKHSECLSFEEQVDVPVEQDYNVLKFAGIRALVATADYDLLMLHYNDKFTYEELSRIYGRTPSYIKMKIFRIIRRLKRNLKDKEL